MNFYPDAAPVPMGLQTNEFMLRMLRATDVERDYDAVMTSSELLHLRSGGAWPRDDFTLAENLADLQKHEWDFQARTGFTYIIMNLSETECLGCVYIYPLATLLQHLRASDEVLRQLPTYAAQASFWVRLSRIADDLDRRVLTAIWEWLRQDFAFRRVVMRVAAAETRQFTILQDAGLSITARYPTRKGELLLFA